MSVVRILFIRTFFIIVIMYLPYIANAQWDTYNNTSAGLQETDTSDYIPLFYKGAPEYNLMIASSKGYVSEIERLIRNGADINAETSQGVTPLIYAVSNNQLAAVKMLLSHNPSLDRITSRYETALLIAVKNQNFDIAEALIRAGCNVNLADKHGATPLHHAALYGYLDIVDLLLYYESTIDEKTTEGTTPLLASIQSEHYDVADLLIQNGANMEARDNDGFTPFLMAAFYGDTLIMDLLYKKGVNIYAVNKSNFNALTLSILANHIHATSYLLKIGNKWTNSENTAINPYTVASEYRRKEIIEILKKNNIPGHIKHNFNQMEMAVSSRFCLHDIYTGMSFSFKEPSINGGIITGCYTKLWYTRVLIKDSERLFYQYKNKESLVYAGLFKDFTFTDHYDKMNLSLSTSLLAGYSFGNNLKGTFIVPENKLIIIPSVSFKMTKMNFSLNMGMEYMKTAYYNIGPLWLRIGCSYTHFFNNVKTQFKTIKWD